MSMKPMKWKKFIVGYVLALAIFLFAQRRPMPVITPVYSSIIDLTHSVEVSPKAQSRLKTLAPLGTYIEAPANFAPQLWTVDQIPSERLIAPLVILDVEKKVSQNPDYQVSMDDIVGWENAHGQLPMGAVVMARTGWDYRWNSIKQYQNLDHRGVMHFPGYSLDAAKFLVQGRKILGLGIDTLSVDSGASKDFAVRNYTLAHSLYHLQNVANLSTVAESGATVVVAPAKVEGSNGGPVRILALVK